MIVWRRIGRKNPTLCCGIVLKFLTGYCTSLHWPHHQLSDVSADHTSSQGRHLSVNLALHRTRNSPEVTSPGLSGKTMVPDSLLTGKVEFVPAQSPIWKQVNLEEVTLLQSWFKGVFNDNTSHLLVRIHFLFLISPSQLTLISIIKSTVPIL